MAVSAVREAGSLLYRRSRRNFPLDLASRRPCRDAGPNPFLAGTECIGVPGKGPTGLILTESDGVWPVSCGDPGHSDRDTNPKRVVHQPGVRWCSPPLRRSRDYNVQECADMSVLWFPAERALKSDKPARASRAIQSGIVPPHSRPRSVDRAYATRVGGRPLRLGVLPRRHPGGLRPKPRSH